MKKLFIIIATVLLLITGCSKEEKPKHSVLETQRIILNEFETNCKMSFVGPETLLGVYFCSHNNNKDLPSITFLPEETYFTYQNIEVSGSMVKITKDNLLIHISTGIGECIYDIDSNFIEPSSNTYCNDETKEKSKSLAKSLKAYLKTLDLNIADIQQYIAEFGYFAMEK